MRVNILEERRKLYLVVDNALNLVVGFEVYELVLKKILNIIFLANMF